MNKIPYRGYLICHNYMSGHRWIEKDGMNIRSGFESALTGRQIVDELFREGNPLTHSILSTGPL